jgi:hypothetical protein
MDQRNRVPGLEEEMDRDQLAVDVSRLRLGLRNGMEEDLETAILHYLAERERYHHLCRTTGQPSYLVIEGPQIEIARALLKSLGLPISPLSHSELFPPAEIRSRGCWKVPIPEELRWAVFSRDDFRCVKCGKREFLRADHIFPESKGGEAVLENLQTLCRNCNSRKGTN